MRDRGMSPTICSSLEHIAQLPFTVKADLRDSYPFGLFASPMEDVVRLHASSGTTGKPNVVAYTRQDLNVWTGGWCAASPPAAFTAVTSSRTPTATACLPVDSASITAPKCSAPPSSPSPAAIPNARSW